MAVTALVNFRVAADRLASVAAKYLDTGRGDLDGALDAYRAAREAATVATWDALYGAPGKALVADRSYEGEAYETFQDFLDNEGGHL